MSEVKRYDLVGDMDGNCNLNEARMEISADGIYVKHKDYAKLKEKYESLAAENAELKSKGREVLNEACKVYDKFNANVDSDSGDFMDGQTLHEFHFVLDVETPDTDAFLAEVRAQGVEMFAQWCRGERDFTLIDEDVADAAAYEECVKRAEYFSVQIRKGGEQK